MGYVGGEEETKGGDEGYGSSRRRRRRGFKYITDVRDEDGIGMPARKKKLNNRRMMEGSWEKTGGFISRSHPRHMNMPRPFTSQAHFPSLNGTVSIRSRVAAKTCQTAEDPTCF